MVSREHLHGHLNSVLAPGDGEIEVCVPTLRRPPPEILHSQWEFVGPIRYSSPFRRRTGEFKNQAIKKFVQSVFTKLDGPMFTLDGLRTVSMKPNFKILDKLNKIVKIGGRWKPKHCKTSSETAVIVPFRNREWHLTIFLQNIHSVLQAQNIAYQIYVIEQKVNIILRAIADFLISGNFKRLIRELFANISHESSQKRNRLA